MTTVTVHLKAADGATHTLTMPLPPVTTTGWVKPTAASCAPRVSLTPYNGNFVVSRNNQVISGLAISGNLVIGNYSGVTVSDCTWTYMNTNVDIYGNQFNPPPANITLTNCVFAEIYGTGFNGLTMTRCHITQLPSYTGMQLSIYSDNSGTIEAQGLVMTSCLIDPPKPTSNGTHLEGIHLMSCSNVLIQGCWINYLAPNAGTTTYVTASINIQNYEGLCDNVVIDNNWIDLNPAYQQGGYYLLYFAATNGKVTNNKFSGRAANQVLYPRGAYPASQLPGGVFPEFTQSGNTLSPSGPGGTYTPVTL